MSDRNDLQRSWPVQQWQYNTIKCNEMTWPASAAIFFSAVHETSFCSRSVVWSVVIVSLIQLDVAGIICDNSNSVAVAVSIVYKSR